MITIKPLLGVSLNQLNEAWQDAFSEYVYKWSQQDIAKMLARRGYDASLSFGAFDGPKLVSYTLNCTGTVSGRPSVYDTGSGTIKAYRRQGLATRIFNESLPYLKQAGIQQYWLDVLQENTNAVSVYRQVGFEVTRGLHTFRQSTDALALNEKMMPAQYAMRPIDLSYCDAMRKLWAIAPSWQNSLECLARVPDDFKMIGVFDGGQLAAYGIIIPQTGDIPQLAVGEAYRRQGIGAALLKELLRHNNATAIRLANVDASYEPMAAFAINNGMAPLPTQYEMMKNLE
jgi:ribosomal protein S18 acetylase RimI-like enzyme